jgi:hypothetical protein
MAYLRHRRVRIQPNGAEKLPAAHGAGQLTFHGAHAALVNTKAFAAYLAPLKRTRWFVYAKLAGEPLKGSTQNGEGRFEARPVCRSGMRASASRGRLRHQGGPGVKPGKRRTNAASRVLGVGHPLFDIALDDAQDVSARFARVEALSNPLLIVSVEDEVTGTGTLIHRLIFGVIEKETKIEILRDWELLQALNALTPRSSLGERTVSRDAESMLERLKQAFDTDLSTHASTLRRPVSWTEMLFLPSKGG